MKIETLDKMQTGLWVGLIASPILTLLVVGLVAYPIIQCLAILTSIALWNKKRKIPVVKDEEYYKNLMMQPLAQSDGLAVAFWGFIVAINIIFYFIVLQTVMSF